MGSTRTNIDLLQVPLAAIIKTLEKFECWPFESPSGAKAILKCVLSPTDDVRATAASILISTGKHYQYKTYCLQHVTIYNSLL
jgi:hypothetical protein